MNIHTEICPDERRTPAAAAAAADSDLQLMEKKTGVARSSASEGYIMKENMQLWSHVQKNRVSSLEEGINLLR